jgi:hypothetical protein
MTWTGLLFAIAVPCLASSAIVGSIPNGSTVIPELIGCIFILSITFSISIISIFSNSLSSILIFFCLDGWLKKHGLSIKLHCPGVLVDITSNYQNNRSNRVANVPQKQTPAPVIVQVQQPQIVYIPNNQMNQSAVKKIKSPSGPVLEINQNYTMPAIDAPSTQAITFPSPGANEMVQDV